MPGTALYFPTLLIYPSAFSLTVNLLVPRDSAESLAKVQQGEPSLLDSKGVKILAKAEIRSHFWRKQLRRTRCNQPFDQVERRLKSQSTRCRPNHAALASVHHCSKGPLKIDWCEILLHGIAGPFYAYTDLDLGNFQWKDNSVQQVPFRYKKKKL